MLTYVLQAHLFPEPYFAGRFEEEYHIADRDTFPTRRAAEREFRGRHPRLFALHPCAVLTEEESEQGE